MQNLPGVRYIWNISKKVSLPVIKVFNSEEFLVFYSSFLILQIIVVVDKGYELMGWLWFNRWGKKWKNKKTEEKS